MRSNKTWTACACVLALLVTSCGGGGSGGSGGGSTPTPTPTPAPTSTPTPIAGCSLRERQDWAEAQLREWYLFPETLPANANPAAYTTLDDYIDSLTANARAQNRDRFFTYRTSIAEENAYYEQGSSAGLGVRLGVNSAARRLFVIEAFETGPGATAGMRRGTEILAIGTSSGNLQTVQSLWVAGGVNAVADALGPDEAGVTRVLQISDASGTRNITVAKRDFALQPVSSTYGYKVIDQGGRKVGYLNLRTFISTAEPQMRTAFAAFRAAGVTQLVVDLRYNGGGLISVAELMGNLMGANRTASDVFSHTVFRPEKSAENTTAYFAAQAESVAPTKIAFITSGGTASASELVINSFLPYLNADVALIGANTYGKPVGQIAIDRPSCDDRLRIVALKTQNSAGEGDYFNGLADRMKSTCTSNDDISYDMGDPREDSTRVALQFLSGQSCTPIVGQSMARMAVMPDTSEKRDILAPARPNTPQREVPGLF
ncbi:S41 family peptidase [Sphingomonas sp. LH128]|uniref:S41 family peptidase n=1 Tax=Sphingomonas sp. LH128 TaxID=473781 RepID=UPI0026B32E9D